MQLSRAECLKEAQDLLKLIEQPTLSRDDQTYLIEETVENFKNYVNPGILEYRKAVSNDYASVEWSDNGCIITDATGKQFLDCLGGFGIFNAGHRHPKIIKAVMDQMKHQALHSQELLDPLRGGLAKLVADLTPGDLQYSFFCNSGTESVEGALKLARLHTGRTHIVATAKGFHGKTMGALSATAKAVFREPFLPLVPGFHHVPFGDADAVEALLKGGDYVGEPIAAVLVEPIQGEGGVNIPDDEYLPRLREMCWKYGTLLILDEVQTGMGRTGKMFACEHWEVEPDILCLGKSFGGGIMPIGAFISSETIWKKMFPDPFIHTSTFGGNPLACAAAIAAIGVTLEEKLPERAHGTGAYFLPKLKALAAEYPDIIVEARGKGLLMAIEFIDDDVGFEFAKGCFDEGVLVAGTLINAKTIRIEPPLTISREQVDQALEVMKKILPVVHRKITGVGTFV